jgi:Protein of unknown function (DUF4231)
MVALSLLKRFPKLRAPAESQSVIPENERGNFPDFASDFALLDRVAAPAFAELDKAALREQNRYRRQRVSIIVGSALITGLGGLQAVFPAQRWPGLLLTVLGIALAAGTRLANERASLTAYLSARARAERLRALHFQYLSAMGRYAGADRETTLRRDVLAIQHGKEPT